jgi:hypothetical protein
MGNASGPHLTPRDIEILLMIYRFDGCVSSQIQRRFWPQIGARSAYYQRLSGLISCNYLRRVALPSRSGYGSGPSFLTLGQAAHPLLLELLDLPRVELRRLRHRLIPAFWQHDAAVRDVHLDLELACAADNVELVEWVNERELKRLPITVPTRTGTSGRRSPAIELIPDGAFTLRLPSGASQTFLFECDMGSIPAARMRQKLRGYLLNARTDPRPVLWVVPTTARRDAMATWARAAAACIDGADATIFWIAVRSAVTSATVLTTPIWFVVDGPPMLALVPTDASHAPTLPKPVAPEIRPITAEDGAARWT